MISNEDHKHIVITDTLLQASITRQTQSALPFCRAKQGPLSVCCYSLFSFYENSFCPLLPSAVLHTVGVCANADMHTCRVKVN